MAMQWLFVLRAVHILAAALWVGAAAMLTLYIMPSVRASGAAGGVVVAEAMRRGVGVFMPSTAGVTILSGLWLYWLWFQGRGGEGLHSAGPIMLMLGALAGVTSAIIGGAVLGRTTHELATLAGAPADTANQARIAALHRRGAAASKLVLTLLVAALLLMVLSRAF